MSFTTGILHGNIDCSDDCPCKNVSFRTNIWTACEHGDYATVSTRIKGNKKLVSLLDSYGYSPLHYAAQHNHYEIVKLLLESKAEVDLNRCGATPLHRAAFANCLQICELLLDYGADINKQDVSFLDYNTPCHKALMNGSMELTDLFIRREADLLIPNAAGQTVQDLLSMRYGASSNVNNVALPEKIVFCQPVIQVLEQQKESIGEVCFVCKQRKLSFVKISVRSPLQPEQSLQIKLVCKSCKKNLKVF